MACEVKWTEIAWRDVEEVSDYISKDSRYYASAFVKEIREASQSLSYFAERGRIVPEFGNSTIREIFVKKYRLIYQVTEKAVYIISFIHSARDLLSFWEEER